MNREMKKKMKVQGTPSRKHWLQQKKQYFVAGIICMLLYSFSFIPFSPPGIATPSPIDPYLNDVFPDHSPTGTNEHWFVENAFPHLTFADPLAFLEVPGEDSYYVAGKIGVIWQIDNDSTTTTKDVVLDISAMVDTDGDAGLLNAILHPEFGQAGSSNRGYIYVMYRYNPNGNVNNCETPAFLRLSRFNRPDGQADFDPNSELVLVQTYDEHCWHNGSAMFFDTEGYFYFAVGDAGGINDPYQTTQKVDGRLMSGMFRIDLEMDPSRSHPIRRQQVDPANRVFTTDSSYQQGYYIPNDNPWQDEQGSVLEEYFAIGLRNPHRASFDSLTGKIWVGDVGQGLREEISVISKGQNLQWPFREGFVSGNASVPDPLIGISTPPIYDYDHAMGNSIIGGLVYRDNFYQGALTGRYIFGDHGVQNIWSYNSINGEVLFLANVPQFGEGNKNGISSFATNSDGEIFVLKLYGTDQDGGVIYRLKQDATVEEPPQFLSQTGAFSDLATLTPASGVIPYDVNAPLWSDRAEKKRWIALPNDGTHDSPDEQITFSATGPWQFPAGTVLIKHFELPVDYNDPTIIKRLETRFFVITEDGGGYGVTYKWNDEGTDAELIINSETKDYEVTYADNTTGTQSWYFPSRTDCMSCHNANSDFILGVSTWQLNGDMTYPSTGVTDNQLNTWNHLGMFANSFSPAAIPTFLQSANLTNDSASLATRVRSYLDSNCAHCHRPGGVEGAFDARFSTPLEEQNLIWSSGISRNTPSHHYIIKPKDTSESELWLRDGSLEDGFAMPPLAKGLVDEAYMDVLTEWINSQEEEACEERSVSSLPWVHSENYLGPVEINSSVGAEQPNDGNPITINGQVFPLGLGMHSFAEVTYNTNNDYALFESYVGIDDETCSAGSVEFEVYKDGVLAYQSPVIRYADDPYLIRVNIEGANQVTLKVTDGGNGQACDHADWANPRFLPCLSCEPFTACDDGDPCTINDQYDENCNCVGTLVTADTDGDGVCDPADLCPGSDDNVDTDGDGIPDGCDSCPTGPNPGIDLVATVVQDALCIYDYSGSIDLEIATGTPPFTYAWSSGETTEDINGKAAGTYTVTVTDANACETMGEFTIGEPDELDLPSIQVTDLTCYGNSSGAIDLVVSGGTLPYTYAWSTGATTEDVNNLAAGTYDVTVTDANACFYTTRFTVHEPGELGIDQSGFGVGTLDCETPATSYIDLLVYGGTLPYTFAWSNGSVTEDLNNIPAGAYQVTVTDANGCTVVGNFDLDTDDDGVPNACDTCPYGPGPEVDLVATVVEDALCHLEPSGSIDLAAISGTPPYTYAWSSGETTQFISGKTAGIYTVTVTDANACEATAEFTITEPDPLDVSSTQVTDLSCFENLSGAIDLVVSGGTLPYTYAWSTGATSEDVNDLAAGTYDVTVTDANACSYTTSFTVHEPAELAIDLISTQQGTVDCEIPATSFIDLHLSGGTLPYTFSWSNGSDTEDLNNVMAGAYQVTVTDANGCTDTASFDLDMDDDGIPDACDTCPGGPGPEVDLVATVVQDALCHFEPSGSIDLVVISGTPPYTYAWSSGETTEDINGKVADTYGVTVMDANGCMTTATFVIGEPDDLTVDLLATVVTPVDCYGNASGAIDMVTMGGTEPYTYAWSNSATTEDISGLTAGTYTVTVTDANSCVEQVSFTIDEPEVLAIDTDATVVSHVACKDDANGTIDLMVSGGTEPYTYAWSNGAATENISDLSPGSYTLTITDASGCNDEATFAIDEPEVLDIDTDATVVIDVTCYGDPGGSIDLVLSGGTEPYTYLWSNGATTEDLTGLYAGTYDVTLTDANACTEFASFSVQEPSEFLINMGLTQTGTTDCNLPSSSYIDLSVDGGVLPLTFAWSNGGTTEDLAGLSAGTYSVTVTDASGCNISAAFNLDTDNDGVPNECDICEGADDALDSDGDGVPDGCDECPGFNDAIDSDEDGIPDACDSCVGLTGLSCDDGDPCTIDDVYDENCNCAGTLTPDSDGDGICDGMDQCPDFPDHEDEDLDGVPDACDQCPGFFDDEDLDADGIPDGCDLCQGADDNIDEDVDGIPDGCDPCVGRPDPICETDDCELNTDPIASGVYAADYELSSTGVVHAGSDVNFVAGNSIVLKPGFRVMPNGHFHAEVVECSTPASHGEPIPPTIRAALVAQNTRISYTIPFSGDVTIQVLDLTGQVILTPLQGAFVEAGEHVLSVFTTLPSGLYYVRLQHKSGTVQDKLLLNREKEENPSRKGVVNADGDLIVSVRPNPFRHDFRLYIEPPIPELKRAIIRITDISGRIIYQRFDAPFNQEIVIVPHAGWVDGIYIMQVRAGGYTVTHRLVKQ